MPQQNDSNDPTAPGAEPSAGDRLAAAIRARVDLSPDGRIDADDIFAEAGALGIDPDTASAVLRRGRERGIVRPDEGEATERKVREQELVRARGVDLRRAVARAGEGLEPPFVPFGFALLRAIDFTLMSSSALEVVQKTPERPSLGLVIAVGDGFLFELARTGNHAMPEPGSVVMFSKYGGQEVLLPEGRFWVVAPREVFGLYKGTIA